MVPAYGRSHGPSIWKVTWSQHMEGHMVPAYGRPHGPSIWKVTWSQHMEGHMVPAYGRSHGLSIWKVTWSQHMEGHMVPAYGRSHGLSIWKVTWSQHMEGHMVSAYGRSHGPSIWKVSIRKVTWQNSSVGSRHGHCHGSCLLSFPLPSLTPPHSGLSAAACLQSLFRRRGKDYWQCLPSSRTQGCHGGPGWGGEEGEGRNK